MYISAFMITESSCLKHIINSTFVLIDFMISAVPIRIQHVIYPFIAGLIYVAFSYNYYAYGGTGPMDTPYIYYNVNWNYPERATICCAIVMCCVIMAQIVLFILYNIRLSIFKRIENKHNTFDATDNEKLSVFSEGRSRDGSYASTLTSLEDREIQDVSAY